MPEGIDVHSHVMSESSCLQSRKVPTFVSTGHILLLSLDLMVLGRLSQATTRDMDINPP